MRVILFLLSSLSTVSMCAQRSEFTKSNFITLSIQESRETISDVALQLQKFEGTFPKFVLRFESIQENTDRWFVELNASHFGFTFHKTNIDVESGNSIPSTLIDNDLKIAWSKKVGIWKGFGIHLGPQFSSDLMVFNNNDSSKSSWLSSQQLELMIRAFMPIVTRQNLELYFTYSLVGFHSRPDLLIIYDFGEKDASTILDNVYSNQTFSHPLNYINPEFHARYTYTFGKIGLYANLFYEYLLLNESLELKRSSIGGEFGVYFRM